MDSALPGEDLLRSLDAARQDHSRAVGAKAASVIDLVAVDLRADVVAAATLHDIGYARPILGFHPLDGADFLREQGFSAIVCHLVAHHSASTHEADARGIDLGLFEEFEPGRDDLGQAHAVVWWADLTTGPHGQDLTVEQRLADIEKRYPAYHVVARNVRQIRPILLAAGQSPVGSIRVPSWSSAHSKRTR